MKLLNGEKEEIILREKDQLNLIATAVEEAKRLGAEGEELAKLSQLNNALFRKIDLPGTKAQLKPVYSKRQANKNRKLTKLTLVFKWGGEVRLMPAVKMTPIEFVSVHSFGAISISRPWREHEEGYIYHEYDFSSTTWHISDLTFRQGSSSER